MIEGMLTVVPVRAGELPAGAAGAVAESEGRALVAGSDAEKAAKTLAASMAVKEISAAELGDFRPALWARLLAPLIPNATVVLPATPDGRDLAPRLAAELARPLLAPALRVTKGEAFLVRHDGRQIAHYKCEVPFVATLLPAPGEAALADVVARPSEEAGVAHEEPPIVQLALGAAATRDAEIVEVLEADPAVMDLSEADRIFAAGAGVGTREAIDDLGAVAARLGASLGASRVVTDAGLLGQERQIGTTGVSVRPRLYVAFGVSGAAQHVGGLGAIRHIIAVNVDPSCPMMSMADVALVTDARKLLGILRRRLAVAGGKDLGE
jgi:electron transfer flavoprotein alpha subunit